MNLSAVDFKISSPFFFFAKSPTTCPEQKDFLQTRLLCLLDTYYLQNFNE